MIKLDYTLKTPEERCKLVEQILAEPGRKINNKYLEILSDYIMDAVSKEDVKKYGLMTENRMATVNKRETSFEGLISQFENGEDGIYDLINDNERNTIFKPKISITEKDLAEIPELCEGQQAIEYWEKILKTATGKEAYIAKKAIIELRKDQYLIKDAMKPRTTCIGNRSKPHVSLKGDIKVDKQGNCILSGVSLLDPKCICGILCNYEALREKADLSSPSSDLWCLMEDFENLRKRVLINYPIYDTIVYGKTNGLQNIQIQELLKKEHNINYTVEYISSLWRNKIPELIAGVAEEEYLNWYYTHKEKGTFKKCNRCGKVKLAHNKYFSKNKSSKDGWYSICKECRNKKGKND